MIKQFALVVLSMLVMVVLNSSTLLAQETGQKDTFFLSRSRGLLGKLGKSLSTDGPGIIPIKTANPYMAQAGKTIRNIGITSLGFERSLSDTTVVRNTFSTVVANFFHKNTRENIIYHNLFFREGDKINPYIVADNERHLRDLVYIKDARIFLVPVTGSTDLVDVVVITKDIFSIGGNFSANGVSRVQVGLKEANLHGSGSQLAFSTFYEKSRNPTWGYGAEMIRRNMGGSFIDWTMGFQTYRNAFNSGRHEETFLYTHLEKPLVSLYIPWIGAADFSYSKTHNLYIQDSLYESDYRYSFYNVDAWFGYNFGNKKLPTDSISNRLRKLIAVRGLYQHFNQVPQKNETRYDYNYANISGVLLSISAFKQEFYKTNFIYGFGINEDVPEGFSASFIAGITDKDKRNRNYYGLDVQRSHLSRWGYYTTYTFRFGGYSYKNRWEDIDLLLGVDHFTRLYKMSDKWYNRNFYSASITQQSRPVLNEPLLLRSMFGLPYYDNSMIAADVRGTLKGETVFYDMNRYWGFRIAPFLFADMSVIRPIHQSFDKSELYSALGGGVRTRNENLIFGTIELRGYFFPRPIGYMHGYKVEVSTSLRFKYNSTFIRKPDFVLPN